MHVVLVSDETVKFFLWVFAFILVFTVIWFGLLIRYAINAFKNPPKVYIECPHPTIHSLTPQNHHWAN